MDLDRAMWGSAVGGTMILMSVPYLLLALAIPYAVLRLRDSRGVPDPQAGFKAAMYFFFSVSILLILLGATIFVVDLIMQADFGGRGGRPALQRESFPNAAQRVALGFIVSGGIFTLLHFICILTLTDQPFSSPVRRMFLGWRFAIHGIIVMTAVTALMIILFQKNEGGAAEARRFFIGVLLVWAPSWFIHFVLLRVSSPVPQTRIGWEPEFERPAERGYPPRS